MAYSCFPLPLVVYWDLPAMGSFHKQGSCPDFAGTTIAVAEH
jgi:hypothetical protein